MPQIAFIARPKTNKFGESYISLRCGEHVEWAQIKYVPERGGWVAWGGDEDLGKVLRARIHFLRHADVKEVLKACREGYEFFYDIAGDEPHVPGEDELRYETWAHNLGDATGPGQDWDCNGTWH